MKKNILAIILLAFSLSAYAQQVAVRSEIFLHKSGEYIDAVRVSEGGKEIGLRIQLWADNQKNKKIDRPINIAYMKPVEFHDFMNELIDCFRYEKGTTLTINGLTVEVDNTIGKDNLIIYSKDKLGYHSFKWSRLEQMLTQFEKWCDKNNVNYEEETVEEKVEIDYDSIIKKYNIDSSGNAVIKPKTPVEVDRSKKKSRR